MSSEFDTQKLESCLAECLVDGKLRDILTKTGIPAEETVTLHIKRRDQNLISHEIPKKISPNAIGQTTNDFNCVKEISDFFNQAEKSNNLLSVLHDSDTSTDKKAESLYTLIFEIGNFQFGEPPTEYLRQQIIIKLVPCCPPKCNPCRIIFP